jgi:predicted protein tyrosine phosphatase
MRIQFDIDENEVNRALPFIMEEKHRHAFAKKAFIEWITRQESRNKRRISDIIGEDKKILKPMIIEILKEIK